MKPERQAIEAMNQFAKSAGLPELRFDSTDQAELAGIQPKIFESLQRYIQDRTPVGSFLTAVLCNDLRGAVFLADEDNQPTIPNIVRWLHWEAPGRCWGSLEKVAAWIKEGKEGA